MAQNDWVDKVLKKADQGQTGGVLKESRQAVGSMPIQRPKLPSFLQGYIQQEKPKSNAPSGMEACVKGDIGGYRQQEVSKVFKRPIKNAGKAVDPSKALPFRKSK